MSVFRRKLNGYQKLSPSSHGFRRVLTAAFMISFALLLPATTLAQVCGPLPPYAGDNYLSEHDRFGFNVAYDDRCVTTDIPSLSSPCLPQPEYLRTVSSKPLNNYNIRGLKAGWFFDYKLDTGPVQGLDHLPVVRYEDYLTPGPGGKLVITDEALDIIFGDALSKYPSRLWVIGNEMDRVGQDERAPDLYAEDYRTIRSYILAHDPTAKIAIGAVLQPTAIRMDYLRIVLQAYRDKYGVPLPTDAFTIHSFILDEAGPYGAGLPPQPSPGSGYSYTQGLTTYGFDDHGDIEEFKQRIIDFRAWMKNPGVTGYLNHFSNTPLLITEYGILFGPDTFFTTGSSYFKSDEICNETDPSAPKYFDDGNLPDGECTFTLYFVRDFLTDTLDFLIQENQANGLSTDYGRLVQAASWYSLQDQLRHSLYQVDGFNGNLIDRTTGGDTGVYPPSPPVPGTPVTLLGPTYRTYMADSSKVGWNDFFALSLVPQPDAELIVQPSSFTKGEVSKVKFTVIVRNTGNKNAQPTIAFNTTYNDLTNCSTTTTVLARCGLDKEVTLECDVSNLEPDVYEVYAQVSQLGEDGGIGDNNAFASLTINAKDPTPTPTPGGTVTPTPTPRPTLGPGDPYNTRLLPEMYDTNE